MYRKKLYRKQFVVVAFLGAIIPLLPRLIYDVFNKCQQTCGLVLWSVYRVTAVTGFDGKHSISILSITHWFQSLYVQLEYVFGKPYPFLFIIIAILLAYCGYLFFRKKETSDLFILSLLGTVLLTIGIFIHHSPSEAYVPPYLVLLPILMMYALNHMRRNIKFATMLLMGICIVLQTYALLQNNFYTNNVQDVFKATHFISADSKGQPVLLRSYDNGSEFPTYLDAYRFLLQKQGITESPDGVEYIISQDNNTVLPMQNTDMFIFGHVTVVKKTM